LQLAKNAHDPSNLDLITHLSTPESTFYPTSGEVLSENDILFIVQQLEKHLELYPPGMHFNFGTFPVEILGNPQGVFQALYSKDSIQINNHRPLLANLAICGKSGKSPNIYLCAKANPSLIDIFYGQVNYLEAYTGHVVLSKTPSGIPFLKMYEICLDHGHGLLRHLLTENALRFSAEIPEFALQEIISDGTVLDPQNLVAGTVAHIDQKPANSHGVIQLETPPNSKNQLRSRSLTPTEQNIAHGKWIIRYPLIQMGKLFHRQQLQAPVVNSFSAHPA
jgi:hypothetical protein